MAGLMNRAFFFFSFSFAQGTNEQSCMSFVLNIGSTYLAKLHASVINTVILGRIRVVISYKSVFM